MKSNPRITEISSLLKRSPGSKEFEALLDSILIPSIIVDPQTTRIATANTKAIEQSAFTRDELTKGQLSTLFPHISLEKFDYDKQNSIITPLQKRSGIKIDVTATAVKLKSPAQWVLIQWEKIQNNYDMDNNVGFQEQRWEALKILSTAPQEENLEQSIQVILQAGQLLIGSSFLALYISKIKSNGLEKNQTWGKADFLPNQLELSEVNHLKVDLVWEPGNKTISLLHNKALTEKLKYLATVPIKPNLPSAGILVTGDQITNPPQNISRLLKILASTIITTTKYFDTLSGTEEYIKKLQYRLEISQAIKDLITDSLIFIDTKGVVVDINDTAGIILGYSTNEAKGKHLDEILVSDKPISKFTQLIFKETPKIHEIHEARIHDRGGVSRLTNIKIVPLGSGEEPKTIAILLSDLSQHEEYLVKKEQLEQHAILGEVMASFAHEVRNPINNISTGLQVMSAGFAKEDPIQEEFSHLKEDVNRLADLMKSVLNFSKTKEYKFESINIKQIINSLLSRWKHNIENYKIIAQVTCNIKEPVVKGDRRALEQVFTNVIQNAINVMKKNGGTLGIRIEQKKETGQLGTIEINISDTGPGIPEEIRDRIFEPFFTTNKDGTGIGLAITKRIISAHNGQISLDSFPGGTVFKIKLPAKNN